MLKFVMLVFCLLHIITVTRDQNCVFTKLKLFMVRSLYPVSMITGLIQHRSALTSGIAGRISAVRDLHDRELYAGLILWHWMSMYEKLYI